MLRIVQEVHVLAFFDVVVINDDRCGASLHLSTEFSIMFLLNRQDRISFLILFTRPDDGRLKSKNRAIGSSQLLRDS